MSRPGNGWRWRRRFSPVNEPLWQERMETTGRCNWMIVEKPGRALLAVEAYFSRRAAADALARRWGGQVQRVVSRPPPPARPVRVGAELEIAHDEAGTRRAGQLLIPYGIAFGSGEHATTLMLLRALARWERMAGAAVLDLGTGSGVLALTARLLGARAVAGSDFDAAAIRTARENERRNFGSRQVRWEVADAKKLRPTPKYTLILANLFSGVLVETAPRIARALASGGELWLSGVLRSQDAEVVPAFRAAGLRHLRTTTRGKWVMQQWAR
jgi:ribosomal protein L11 methyltransferase